MAERKADPLRDLDDEGFAFFPANAEAAETLSASQINHYNSKGYVSGIDIFSPDEATSLRDYITGLLEEVVSAPDKRNAYSINSYHLVCERLHDIVTDERILRYVKDILGENVICWGQHLFAKMPGDIKDVPFHQDAIYWPLTPSKTTTVWIAIDDADEENSAMKFIPGSHKKGAVEHEELALDGTRVLGRKAKQAEFQSEHFLNKLKAGQISLHSDLLLHGSEPNHSNRRRAGLTVRYAAADVRLIEGYDHWRKTGVHVLGGDPNNFWYNRRRPEGEHPEKMAELFGGFDGTPLDAS